VTVNADPSTRRVPAIFESALAPLAAALLRDYYTGTVDGRPAFTGARFETLGGRWNDPSCADRFTAGDLAAVSCLSVNVPGAATIRILETQADAINRLLTAMPRIGAPLWEVAESVIGPGSAAVELWWLLRNGRDGLGRTTTSKLMARKRADLIPIYDSVVGSVLRLADAGGHWETMRSMMVTNLDGEPFHRRLTAMAADAGLSPLIAPLRVFDVVVWYAYNSNTRVKSRAKSLADEFGSWDALSQGPGI
jgi:hypothetical protein